MRLRSYRLQNERIGSVGKLDNHRNVVARTFAFSLITLNTRPDYSLSERW